MADDQQKEDDTDIDNIEQNDIKKEIDDAASNMPDATPPEEPGPGDEAAQDDSAPAPMEDAQPIQKAQEQEKYPALPYYAQDPNLTAGQAYLNIANDWKNKIDSGQVHPKTYGDILYGDKSTPAKIGSFLALIAGGMGSGLSGQPNMLMQMMDNQIARDYDSQKQNVENQLNFHKTVADLATKYGQLGHLSLSDAFTQDQLGQMMTRRYAFADQMKQAQAMPNGPAKTSKLQALATLANAMDEKDIDASNLIEARTRFLQSTGSGGGVSGGSAKSAVNYDKVNQLEKMAQTKMVGAPTLDDIGAMKGEASKLEQTRSFRNNFNQAFQEMDKMALAGKLTPGVRQSYITNLANELSVVTGHGADKSEQEVGSMIPQPVEWKKARATKLQNNNRFFDTLESGSAPTLKRMGALNSYAAPKYGSNMVSVILPNGQKGNIPTEKLQEALRRGAKRAQ